MSHKNNGLTELLEEFPELGAGLASFVEEEGSELTGIVGIFALLKLRLRTVVALLPQASSDDHHSPSEGSSSV